MKAAFAAYKYRQNNVKVQQNVAHIKGIQRNELNYRILHLHTSLYRIHTKATVLFRQGRSPHSTKIKKKAKQRVWFQCDKTESCRFLVHLQYLATDISPCQINKQMYN